MNSLSEHDLDILWEYRNHQEELLYQRINVFLIVQSMLFVAYAESAANKSITGAIAYLGTVVTILGLFAIIRQEFVFKFARNHVKAPIPAYKDLQEKRKAEEDKRWFHRHFEGQKLLCNSIPLLMLLVWLALTTNAIDPNIKQDLINKIDNTVTSFILSVVGVFLSILFFKRNSFWPLPWLKNKFLARLKGSKKPSEWFKNHKQELLACLPLMMLLGWLSWGVLVLLEPMDWIKKHKDTLNYIAFGLVILFVVLLPAFREKSLEGKDSKQKSASAT